jgi:uncharacterized protein YndB with AHSA1/START domain
MKAKNKTDVRTEGKKLIITRIFDAPPETMFEVWSSCEHLKHWWGPKEWPMEECTMDFREGGQWHFCLRGPNEGDESWGLATYKEINKSQRIVYQDNFSDEDANINEKMPEMLITVEFLEHKGKTRQVSTTLFDTEVSLKQTVEMGVVEGTESQMDRLDEYLPTIR